MDGVLAGLFERYESVVVLDTETSGLFFAQDEIIELAAAVVRLEDGEARIVREYDRLIRLSAGRRLPAKIVSLTGITDEALERDGVGKDEACRDLASLLDGGRTLLAAYNAHFDLSFLFYFLRRDGDPAILRGPDFLDVLTVYKDRRSYPHKLSDAISAYGLEDAVVNSHRAIDDVKATVEVLKAMDRERDDLLKYVNLFGYNPKYGIEGKRIRSVEYAPQPYGNGCPLYETAQNQQKLPL